ncbi:MAG: polyprenyl synthetase family protein [Verrucomicrobia bacterium]|nr:polyprenyl synthetase family protein [Verrucomicrobiota bacterium]
MEPHAWWPRRTEQVRALMTESFTHGMGRMERAQPRIAAALRDILARPGSLARSVTAYQLGLEMEMAEDAARALACGIEYLHTASLVFDDLPAMDDARVRRGAACVHITHGESIAMLAALALVNRGFTMLWQGIHRADPARRAKAGEWVDARLGIHGVIGGQAHDLNGWRAEQNAADVSEVAARKTGDLLRLAVVLPAMLGRATEREIQLLDRLAVLRGLAYQAADDLKDVISPVSASGKSCGRDADLGRPNLVAAEGLTAAMERFHRLRRTGDRVQAALPGPPERWGMLDLLRVPAPDAAMVPDLEWISAAV